MGEFTLVQGDNRRLDLVMQDPAGAVIDLTGATLTWRAGPTPYGAVLIEKIGTIDGLPTAGTFHIDLLPDDTLALAGTYHHWVKMTAGGVVSTIYYGTFTVSPINALGTIEAFKARFPEFALVADSLIAILIAESAPAVGTNWRERDRQPAVYYLVAHRLTMEGYGRGQAGSSGVGSSGAVKRRRVGDVETEYAGVSSGGASSGAAGTGYDASTYGQQFLRLRRSNFAAVAVV